MDGVRGEQGLKAGHVQLGGSGVELNGLASNHQERGGGVVIVDGAAQAYQTLAQIPTSRRLYLIRPEQAGQRLAPVGAIGFHSQVSQQRPRPVGGEDGGLVVQRDLERAQE